MLRSTRGMVGWAALLVAWCGATQGETTPRPEHPRPDAVRPHWSNLNGTWQFRFDPGDEGTSGKWFEPGAAGFDRTIVVPFGWESELAAAGEIPREAKIGWYRRTFTVPDTFPKNQRVWLHFGAVDWQADVWVNGKKVASHEGGYTPFSADVTDALASGGGENVVIVRAFDPTDRSLPTGKQVGWYTPTSGIWQTVWLEARPKAAITDFVVTTESLDQRTLKLAVTFQPDGPGTYTLELAGDLKEPGCAESRVDGDGKSAQTVSLTVTAKDGAAPWTPETPNLYGLTLKLRAPGDQADEVTTYFGLRTIARGKLPGDDFERVLLNGKPVYLRLALDQSFNPKGVYTAPSDDFLKRDILLGKFAGLNGVRIHIKPEEPRRLYWADRLGFLIMQDMPNTWEQNDRARTAWEATMREVLPRDRNHPSIFCWVAFNETWGLGGRRNYADDRDTQAWVKRMMGEMRKLDPTRLVEDNSPCNYDHVEGTDLNSWHFYIDDHRGARDHVQGVVERSTPGSTFNYCPGELMNTAPLINSEYGSVSAGGGDRDISWGFRDLTTILRKHNKVQGYVYTELTDIEWEHNGFYNYDRSPKVFGYEEWVPDMWVNELQQADFVGFDAPPVIVARPGETITVPVFVSHYSEREHPVKLRWWLQGFDDAGNTEMVSPPRTVDARWEKYRVTWQEPIRVKVPERPFVGALALTLRQPRANATELEQRFAANFVNVVVKPETPLPRLERRAEKRAVIRFAPEDFARSRWTESVDSPAGKVSGRGKGFIEYRLKLPAAVVAANPKSIYLKLEAGAKAGRELVDWPDRVNRQDYPQTEARAWKDDTLEGAGNARALLNRLREPGQTWPSTLAVSLNGQELLRDELENDAADARGVLSHLNRVDHGSHGDLVTVAAELSDSVRADLKAGKPLVLRLSVPDDAAHAGGLTVFGAETGMYPLDPTLDVETADALPKDLGVDPNGTLAVDRMVTRRVPVVAAGRDAGPKAAVWSYTTRDPGNGWQAPGFDDHEWKRGSAGFGTEGTPAVQVQTRWDTPRIWLRTTVELPKLEAADRLSLRLFHDEDVEVFVNGKRLLNRRGYTTEYEDVALDPGQKGLFQEGKNVIAVSCRQSGGGQGIDLGLLLLKSEEP